MVVGWSEVRVKIEHTWNALSTLEVHTAGSYGRAAFAHSGVQGRKQKNTVLFEPQVCARPCGGRCPHTSLLLRLHAAAVQGAGSHRLLSLEEG